MEDFNKMKLYELINIWSDLAAVDVDFFKLEDSFHEKKLQLEYIISDKMGLCVKDTKAFLNTKKVAKREETLYYVRKNKKQRVEKGEAEKAKHNIRMEKKIYEVIMILEKIKINIREMKKSNYEIVVGTSTQVQLAREMGQKLNGARIFLTKITNYKQKER